jgi:hypothetical protein
MKRPDVFRKPVGVQGRVEQISSDVEGGFLMLVLERIRRTAVDRIATATFLISSVFILFPHTKQEFLVLDPPVYILFISVFLGKSPSSYSCVARYLPSTSPAYLVFSY